MSARKKSTRRQTRKPAVRTMPPLDAPYCTPPHTSLSQTSAPAVVFNGTGRPTPAAPVGRMEETLSRLEIITHRLDNMLSRLGAINMQLFSQTAPKLSTPQGVNANPPGGQFDLLDVKLATIIAILSAIEDEISRLAQV